MLRALVEIPLGLLYANAGEWMIHKYVLHGPDSRKPGGMWSFHFLEHHRHARLKIPLHQYSLQQLDVTGIALRPGAQTLSQPCHQRLHPREGVRLLLRLAVDWVSPKRSTTAIATAAALRRQISASGEASTLI